MAREFANTAGSPTQDYIAYSPVAAVAGAGKLSMVIRGGFDSDIPTDAGIFSVTEATTFLFSIYCTIFSCSAIDIAH